MSTPKHTGTFGGAAERLTTLQQLTAALARARSYDQVASVIIDEALPALCAEVGVVALLSEDGRTLRNVAFKGVDEGTQAAWDEYSVESPAPVAEAARTGAAVVVRTLAERNERYPVLAAVHGLERGGPVVALPLCVDGKIRGVLAFCWGFALVLEDDGLAFLRTLAEQCVQAIERARLYVVAAREIAERRAAEELLREASERKDAFLAMLAHELRNPLAPIRAAADLLEVVDDGRLASARAVIQRQTEHMRRLVDDLLDAARAAQGRLTLQASPINLTDVVRATALDQAEAFACKGLVFKISVPAEPLWLHADGARLAQALTNLLHNARKFSPPKTQVSLLLKPPAHGQVQLEVRDEGAGIEPNLLPHLFEPFAQGDRSLSRTQGGLGLGLSIVRAIAQLHAGNISVESAGPGAGAVFTLTLPIVAVEVPTRMERAARPNVRKRVLVVEDNRDAAEMMALLLDSFGHDVRLAYHANDALTILDSWNAQVILSDIGLPDVDGYALAERIRARGNPTFRPLLVAISGYGRETDRSRAQAAGFDLYLTKPVDSHALADVLSRSA
jgi:signal transduction histidine kinase/ActR/RegA family two-component response regulator